MGHTCDECKYKRLPEDEYPCCKCWDADKFEPEEGSEEE